MNKYIRELRDGDLEYLAENLRDADKEEVLANNTDPLSGLQESVGLSHTVKIIDFSGQPAAIFGVANYDIGREAIWMVGTAEIAEHPKVFLRYSRETIKQIFEETGALTLFNYTYAGNTLHHKWLRWIGAQVGPVKYPYGPDQKDFYPFVIERETYV